MLRSQKTKDDGATKKPAGSFISSLISLAALQNTIRPGKQYPSSLFQSQANVSSPSFGDRSIFQNAVSVAVLLESSQLTVLDSATGTPPGRLEVQAPLSQCPGQELPWPKRETVLREVGKGYVQTQMGQAGKERNMELCVPIYCSLVVICIM